MGVYLRVLILALLVTGSFSRARAQASPGAGFSTQVAGRTVRFAPVSTFLSDAAARGGSASPSQLLFKLDEQLAPGAKTALEEAGCVIQDYLGEGVYVVRLTAPERAQRLDGVAGVQGAALYEPTFKIETGLQAGPTVFDALVQFYPDASPSQFKALIEGAGGIIITEKWAGVGAAEVRISAAAARTLAASPLVRYISPAPRNQTLNFDSRGLSGGFLLERPAALGGYGLSGAGVTVGVGDDVPASLHIDTRERATNFTPSPLGSSHGSHVSGTIAATGIIDPFGRGFAPRVSILNHYFSQVWAQTSAMHAGYGMTLTNNSYKGGPHRCDYNGTYDVTSSLLDAISVSEPEVLHVFASGNDGHDTCLPFIGRFNTLPGGYQTAKNVVTVGNLTKEFSDLFFSSSRGPAKDGRLKPEICALGDAVYSTTLNNNYAFSWGTSMSAPGVTGGLTLLTERYRAKNGGSTPPAALLKGILLNGASDRGVPGPDYAFGFGSMNLLRSLVIIDSARTFSGTASGGSSQTFSITVPPGTAQLKVMLCYPDRAALPAAAQALVNDLDLEVSGGSGTHLPLILNPAPQAVNNPATEGADRRNNVEQVVIAAPAAGTYTATVKGFSVPMGPQPFHVTYDFLPAGIRVQQPMAGTAYIAGYGHKIYWEAVDTGGTFTLEYSTDGGSNWSSIVSGLPGSRRGYNWAVPGTISSGQCRVRITRSNPAESVTTGLFAINAIQSIGFAATQCPGYAAIGWSATPNATGYQVMRKMGVDMQPVDTVTATSFVFSGLSPDSVYFIAVRPLFGTVAGYRSYAIARKPSDGTCAGAISDGDLALIRIQSPRTGRQGTLTALTASQPVQVWVRNLDDVPSGPYSVSYRMNGGAAQTVSVSTPIPALDSALVTLPAQNLAAPGTYVFQYAVAGIAPDPVRINDSLALTVRQLSNAPVNLAAGLLDDFETTPVLTVQRDSLGVTPTERWDFSTGSPLGRLRGFVSPDVTLGGARSLSMDAEVTHAAGTQNYLQGTFNVAAYSAATDEVRMDFRYRLHGIPKFAAGNEVQVRGADGAGWMTVARYDTTTEPGTPLRSGSLSLTDAMLAGGQAFSSSTAVRFGQRDTSVIGGRDYGNGLTLDDVRLYTVQNDVLLVRIESPVRAACGLGSSTTLRVKVYNGVQAAQSNVQLYYRLDSGAVQTATLASIQGKDTVTFSFPQPFNASAPGLHRLDVWLSAAGDSYRANDSILGYGFRNLPLVASYPYLQNFEAGDGTFWAEGRASSWGYGTPAAALIHNAASGTKAWKTGLTGLYNDREQSYLYTPCFDYGALSTPMLSFSAAVDIENCGENYLCDAAWLEWSSDGGASWAVLGDSGQGFNWYNSNVFNSWTVEGFTRWHVASIPLPKGVTMPVRLRFAMKSDGGETREGLSIDDVHVYDGSRPLYGGVTTGPLVQSVAGGIGPVPFVKSGAITAALSTDGGSSLGSTEVQTYTHASFIDSNTARYFLPRSFTVKPERQPADSALVQLYVSDDDVVKLLSETSCSGCSRPQDVYRLGMTKYDSPVEEEENGTLRDNLKGLYNFYPYTRMAWVPYDRGYYAEAHVKGFSEFWFFDDGPSVAYPPADAAVTLTAKRTNATQVRVEWASGVDSTTVQYELQRAIGSGGAYATIRTEAGLGGGGAQGTQDDAPPAQVGDTVLYRMKWRTLDGSQFYTTARRIPWTAANVLSAVFPNPVEGGLLTLRWSAEPDKELGLVITDAAGRTVYNATYSPNGFDNETRLRLPLAAGIYFLRAELDGQRYSEKLVVR